MDLRKALDNLAQYIPSEHEGAREAAWHVGMAATELVDRVTELERLAESQRIELLTLTRRVERVDGASAR
jgi:hypothetical protein